MTDSETGERRQRCQRGFTSEGAATKELRKRLAKADAGEYVEPSREKFGTYLDTWVAGLRLAPSTRASYTKNIRVHIKPALGGTPLSQITAPMLSRLYRQLEESGHRDGRDGGLSARTVRYIHTIVHKALKDAVKAGALPANPADRAVPPSAKEARPPEMTVWTAEQLSAFLGWAAEHHADLHPAWAFMAATGVRRGEALALRWGDVDLDKARVADRLGHTKPTITLSVYAHVIPSMSQAASRWSELMNGTAR